MVDSKGDAGHNESVGSPTRRASTHEAREQPVSLDEWLAGARAGQSAAFEQLWSHFQPQLYHLAYHHLGNRDDALDACQDAAADAWRAIRRFEGDPDDARRWLIRIVVNASLDLARRETRRARLPLEDPSHGDGGLPRLPDPGQSPEEYAVSADLHALLERCLARLSIEHRTLMLLDQLGLSYAEMAEVTSTETGTVKSRLSRARARVRDLLAGEPAWFSEPRDPARRSMDQGSQSVTGREIAVPIGGRDAPDEPADHP